MIVLPAMSQSDFQEGFIITQSGDSIYGFINNKGSLKNLSVCQFRKNKDSELVEYKPDEIKGFRINERGFYESFIIKKEDVEEHLFLEKLVDGKVDIYKYSKINESYFILRTEDGNTYDLTNSILEIENEDGRYTKQKKEYRYTLRYVFRESPRIVNKVNSLPYETNAIVDIAREYHNEVCDEYECIIYTKQKSGIALRIGLYIGYSISNISFQSEYVEKMNQDFSASGDVFVGWYFNLMDPYISERFSLQLDMIYQSGKYSFENTGYNMTYLKIPFSLKYTYPVKRVKPEIQLGIAYNNWIKHEAENIIPEQVIGDALQKRTYQYGLFCRIGLTIELKNRLSLLLHGSCENYTGKPWNVYSVPDGNGAYFTLQESVKTKTDFLNFSIGLQF
jgi:hypothetical protein